MLITSFNSYVSPHAELSVILGAQIIIIADYSIIFKHILIDKHKLEYPVVDNEWNAGIPL